MLIKSKKSEEKFKQNLKKFVSSIETLQKLGEQIIKLGIKDTDNEIGLGLTIKIYRGLAPSKHLVNFLIFSVEKTSFYMILYLNRDRKYFVKIFPEFQFIGDSKLIVSEILLQEPEKFLRALNEEIEILKNTIKHVKQRKEIEEFFNILGRSDEST